MLLGVMGVVLRRCWVWFVGSVPLGAVRGFIEVVGVASGLIYTLFPVILRIRRLRARGRRRRLAQARVFGFQGSDLVLQSARVGPTAWLAFWLSLAQWRSYLS